MADHEALASSLVAAHSPVRLIAGGRKSEAGSAAFGSTNIEKRLSAMGR